MRKLLVVLFAAMIVAGSCFGASVRDNCGCGLGTMLLGDSESTMVVNLVVTFLNGLCANQTFGITSGTLGCDRPASFAENKQVIEYVNDNMDHLIVDVARGNGDSLDSLADLMQVAPAARADLYAKLQWNFDSIFTSVDVSADDVVKNISKVVEG